MVDEVLVATFLEYANVIIRVLLATSPIILIGYILITAREDEEEEQAKREHRKKCGRS